MCNWHAPLQALERNIHILVQSMTGSSNRGLSIQMTGIKGEPGSFLRASTRGASMRKTPNSSTKNIAAQE
jgi:LPS sulfotransferase NodH